MNNTIPKSATQSFATLQPGIPASWRPGPGPTYEAYFIKSGKTQVYVFDVNGKLQLKKISISLPSLPGNIQNSLDQTQQGKIRETAYKVISRTKQRFYE
ncbi:MAG TPA: hypothetical protein ENJ82_06620, partial [Bacteroidetes bacterium]|nr:hypothetical protein [Bacteroidota bacterium]